MTSPGISNVGTLQGNRSGLSRMPIPVIRRGGRGGNAWLLPMAEAMSQPQDGAATSLSQLVSMRSHLHSNVFNEPEDARLTGGTRTLARRVMGLNVIPEKRTAVASVSAPYRAHIA